jgi:hypothetical protein
VFASEYIIGLAHDYPVGFDKNKVNEAITSFIIKTMKKGDNLYVIDASKNIKHLRSLKYLTRRVLMAKM